MTHTQIHKIGFLGFGEAGQAMASSLLRDRPQLEIVAYDIIRQSSQECTDAPLSDRLTHLNSAQALAEHAQLIFSVVTADQSFEAGVSIAPYLDSTHFVADGNSVSPGTKKKTAALIKEKGASYIDMAIMAPIHPKGHQTPLLLAGDKADTVCTIFDQLGCDFQWEGADVGAASIVKMLRSILIKGMESLICEAMTAAVPLGLNERILTSAGKTLGIADMPKLADYVSERVAVHGRRRAAEMREVAKTLEELGLSNHMASAIARHQDLVADMNLTAQFKDDIPQDHSVLTSLMEKYQRL